MRSLDSADNAEKSVPWCFWFDWRDANSQRLDCVYRRLPCDRRCRPTTQAFSQSSFQFRSFDESSFQQKLSRLKQKLAELSRFGIKQILTVFFFSRFVFSGSSSQLIVHSSRVRTPKRHNSESVLYLNEDPSNIVASDATKQTSMETGELRSSRSNHRLFPVSTYMEPLHAKSQTDNGAPLKWAFYRNFMFFFTCDREIDLFSLLLQITTKSQLAIGRRSHQRIGKAKLYTIHPEQ